MSNNRAREVVFAVCAGAFGLLTIPALATMPNPNTTPWTNHSIAIKPGVDISPQHFGTVEIRPKGGGIFDLVFACENGMRGSRNDARYKLEFLQGNTVVRAAVQDCHLGRSEIQFSQRREIYPPRRIDLSNLIDKVTAVRMSATPLAIPPDQRPPRPPPGPHPPCNQGEPGCP